MRIPGIAGEIWNKAGGTAVTLPGSEIFQALEKGTIDATEWLGPANDLACGLPQIAIYYYMPGWHEPGAMLEFTINKQSFEALPVHYQAILKAACRAASEQMLNFYTYANAKALQSIKDNPDVELRMFPVDVLEKLYELTQETLTEMAAQDDMVKEVYDSYRKFQSEAQEYNAVSEEAYYRVRSAITDKS
jgi:TRAP-type mannitol/chloroaromatic compound transport system substrate-binding protein